MKKAIAISLLGGTPAHVAGHVGCSYQAVNQWPDTLPERIADRVLAAQARRYLAPHLIGSAPAPEEPEPVRSGMPSPAAAAAAATKKRSVRKAA